jgi:SAM-dependent methyltransferase
MPPARTYTFRPVPLCEMCGSANRRLLGLRLSASQGLRPRRAEGIAVPVKRCQCGMVYADPLPVPAAMADHYDLPPEEYWTNQAPWDESYFAREIADAKRLLGFTPGMTALDIGAGRGLAMKSLAHAGFDAFGIEPSAPFRDRAIADGADPARLTLAALEDAAFAPASFDFITFGAVLEHLYSPGLALEKALGWLRPGGVIQAEVPSSRWLISRLVNAFFRLAGTTYVTNISPMHAPFHLYEFSLAAFEAKGRELGFTVAEHRFMACDPVHVPRLLKPLAARVMDATKTGMQLTVWLRK